MNPESEKVSMSNPAQERYPVRKVYEDERQGVGYRDFIHVLESPERGIRIGVGGRVVTKPIGEWVKVGWVDYEKLVSENERLNRIISDIDVENPDAVNVMISAMKEQGELVTSLRAQIKTLGMALKKAKDRLDNTEWYMKDTNGNFIRVHVSTIPIAEALATLPEGWDR